MDSKEFKIVFGKYAKDNGFCFKFGAWFKESSECILVLCLQKSNYGNYYQLMIKIYIQGVLGKNFKISKDLVRDSGDIFRGQPKEYLEIFNLELPIIDSERTEKLNHFFIEYLVPFSEKALSLAGIKDLVAGRQVGLLPAIQEDLGL